MTSFAPNKLFYAIEAVLFVAYNAPSKAISSRDIATRQGLPARYLEGLMQKLVRAGILRGIRGPKGGYVLAKERRHIVLSDICRVLEETEKETLRYTTTPLGKHIVAPVWKTSHAAWMASLATVNLADLCEIADKKNIKKTTEDKSDFAI